MVKGYYTHACHPGPGDEQFSIARLYLQSFAWLCRCRFRGGGVLALNTVLPELSWHGQKDLEVKLVVYISGSLGKLTQDPIWNEWEWVISIYTMVFHVASFCFFIIPQAGISLWVICN